MVRGHVLSFVGTVSGVVWGWGCPNPLQGAHLSTEATRPQHSDRRKGRELSVRWGQSGGPPCHAGYFVFRGVLRYLGREILPPRKERGLLSCMRHCLLIGHFSQNLECEEVVWKVARGRGCAASAPGLPRGFLGLGVTPSGGAAHWREVLRPSSCTTLTPGLESQSLGLSRL